MKNLSLLSLFVTAASFTSLAKANYFYDYARVTSAEPIYHYVETHTPQEHCYKVRKQHSATPTIVGAIIGGAIGNAVGHNKSNKKVGAVAGAILGGSIGHDVGKRNKHSHTQCDISYDTIEKVRELRGYQVKYSFQGEHFSTFMKRAPGDKLKVKVNVVPAYSQ